jgi:hypothetical protein
MNVLARILLGAIVFFFVAAAAAQPPTPNRPVVLIPGILGTKLCNSSGEVVWGTAKSLWNFDRLELGDSSKETLQKCGLIDEVQIFGPLFSVKQYSSLLSTLEALNYTQGKDLLIFDYD